MTTWLDAPSLTQEDLVEWAGWSLLRQAKSLRKQGAIQSIDWKHPYLRGVVDDLAPREVELNLRSTTFVQVKCSCGQAGGSRFCVHALALAWDMLKKQEEPIPQVADNPSTEVESQASEPLASVVQSFQVGVGETATLKLLLPPNFKAAIQRQGALVKLELVIGGDSIPPERISKNRILSLSESEESVVKLLESWMGGELHSLLQLKPDQVSQVLETASNAPIFFWSQTPDSPLALSEIESELLPLLPERELAKKVPQQKPEVRRRVQTVSPRKRPSAVDRLAPAAWLRIDGSPHFLSVQINSREDPLYESLRDLLKQNDFRVEPSNGKWWLRDQHKVLNFLAREGRRFKKRFSPAFTENYRQRMAVVQKLEVVTEIAEVGNHYKLQLNLRSNGLEDSEIRQALASGRNYIVKEKGVWLLDPEVLEKFSQAQSSLSAHKSEFFNPHFELKLERSNLPAAQKALEETDFEFQTPVSWEKCTAALSQFGQLAKPPVPDELFEQLRNYQKIGSAWLYHLHQHGLGGILADEMGLGKTVQAIALLAAAKSQAGQFTALIVSPAGLIGNWKRELQRFAPSLNLFINHGADRQTENAFSESIDVVLTSYSTLRNDLDQFIETQFTVIIADEAQHIKNRKTQAAQALRQLAAHSRFVLTGTPIENSIEDLRSLFAFCLPGYLKATASGLKPDERKWLDSEMLSKASHYILRRNKVEVAPELPDKTEQVIWCDFESPQQKLYDQVREKIQRKVDEMVYAGANEGQVRFMMLTELLRLRQVCANPQLLDDQFPFEASAKLIAFREILEEAMDGGHKILLFSQFVGVLSALRRWLDKTDIPYAYIDGKTKDRSAVCETFNEDHDIPICLISLKAGGTGLNLTGANIVVHFDPWWNPAVEDQATDRAHRIGQTKKVNVYKLVCSGTVEDKVLLLQKEKAELLREVLDESAAKTAKVNLDTLKNLLQTEAV